MRTPARTALTAVVLPAAVLTLAACTTPAPLPTIGPSGTSTPSPSATARAIQSIAGLALREVGTGTVASVEDSAAGTVWDVRVVLDDGEVRELHLGTDGRVLAGPSDDPTSADVRSTNRAQVAAAAISLSAAVQRMTAAVPEGRVTAAVLGTYGDRVVWRGDVLDADGVRQDVRIDAVNGAALLNRTDGQGSSGGS